jgi:hypothetical protein
VVLWQYQRWLFHGRHCHLSARRCRGRPPIPQHLQAFRHGRCRCPVSCTSLPCCLARHSVLGRFPGLRVYPVVRRQHERWLLYGRYCYLPARSRRRSSEPPCRLLAQGSRYSDASHDRRHRGWRCFGHCTSFSVNLWIYHRKKRMNTAALIHWMSIVLPFANDTAIVLTNSKLPLFSTLYRTCVESTMMEGHKCSHIASIVCTHQDYINRVIIDLIVYFGLMLYIGKNTLTYGYATGVATGMVLMFFSIIVPNLFMGPSIHSITRFLHINNPYLYILVGIAFIVGLVLLTNLAESATQRVMKAIKVDPEREKHTLT